MDDDNISVVSLELSQANTIRLSKKVDDEVSINNFVCYNLIVIVFIIIRIVGIIIIITYFNNVKIKSMCFYIVIDWKEFSSLRK